MPNDIVMDSRTSTPAQPRSLVLLTGFWICTVIAVAVVLRRVFALAYPPRATPTQLAGLDAVFASHAALTLVHILPALVFVVLAPFVVFRKPGSTLWPERLLFPIGAVVGVSAYAMSAYSIGGWLERSAVLFFDTLFLYSVFRSHRYLQRGELPLERRWRLRAIAILLGIATTRPVMGIFFATASLSQLVPSQFFGIAFWIGFSINFLVFEFWLRSRDRLSSTQGVPEVNEAARR